MADDVFDSDDFDEDLFEDAQPRGEFALKDHKGALVLAWCTEYREQVKTKHGEKDGVVVNVVSIDKTGKGELVKGAMWFGGRIVGRLKGKVNGRPQLGRVIQVPTDKGNPAWDLDEPTDADKAAARKWLAANS